MHTESKIAAAGIGVWLFGVLITLAFWAGVIYVAWHFISKFW